MVERSLTKQERLDSLREVANMIERRPVLGHWPPMRAAPDAADVRWAAAEIERLHAALQEISDLFGKNSLSAAATIARATLSGDSHG